MHLALPHVWGPIKPLILSQQLSEAEQLLCLLQAAAVVQQLQLEAPAAVAAALQPVSAPCHAAVWSLLDAAPAICRTTSAWPLTLCRLAWLRLL